MHKPEMKQGLDIENGTERKGVALRMLGVAAIILGFLDSILSLRGGFAIEPFYSALILGGIVLYVTGLLAGRR